MVDYIDNIKLNGISHPINSDNMSGKWVVKYLSIINGTTASSTWTTYSLDDYLPKDDYDYEVLVYANCQTVNTSGSTAGVSVASGSSSSNVDGYLSRRLCRCNTRTASTEIAGGTSVVPIFSNNRNISVHTTDSSGSPTITVVISGYRRLTKSDNDGNYIENIKTNNTTAIIGGDKYQGQWTQQNVTLFSGTYKNNTIYTFDINSYLPNDNNIYEILLHSDAQTDSTSGHSVTMYVYGGSTNDASINSSIVLGRQTTRTASTRKVRTSGRLFVLPTDRNLTWSQTGASTNGTAGLYMRGYRRVPIDEQENILKGINHNNELIEFGGSNFDGKWAGIYQTLVTASTFATGTTDRIVDLSSILPNDGYDYEVLLSAYTRTANATNSYVSLAVFNSSNTSDIGVYLDYSDCRATSSSCGSGNVILPIRASDKKVLIRFQVGGATSGNCAVYISGYKRLGKNI